MCLRVQKPLLVSGGAMMTFYFLCATDLEHDVRILNRDKKRRIEEHFHLVPAMPSHELLIDPTTGDLYEYSPGLKRWVSKVNSGLHYKPRTETDPFLKKMTQRPKFVAHSVEQEYPLIRGTIVEQAVHVAKVGSINSGILLPPVPQRRRKGVLRHESDGLETSSVQL